MVNYDEYVGHLKPLTRREMIANFEHLQCMGSLGDCALRSHAAEVTRKIGVDMGVVSVMTSLAMACYKNFAQKEIRRIDKTRTDFF